MTRIGDAIRAERAGHRLTLRDVAQGVGISFTYLSDVERGNRLPRHETILRIAAQFPDVPIATLSWLLAEDLFGAVAVEAMRKHAAGG